MDCKVDKHVASRTISMFSETERREEKRPDISIPFTCIIENSEIEELYLGPLPVLMSS